MQCVLDVQVVADWGGDNFVRIVRDVDMGQDQAGRGVECVEHLGCLAVVETVEASPDCLAIDCDDALRGIGCGVFAGQLRVAGKSARPSANRGLKDIPNGGMGPGATSVQTEGGVQATAMLYLDECHDVAIGIAAGDGGKDREQYRRVQT